MKLRMYTRKLELQHSETHFEMLSGHFVTVLVQSVVVSQIRKEHLVLNSNVYATLCHRNLYHNAKTSILAEILYILLYI